MAQELSASELSQLESALYAVLALIAGADGNVDPKEARSFTQMLEAAKGADDKLLAAVAATALAGSAARLKLPLPDAETAGNHVRAAAQLADARLSPEAARRLKQGLYLMGVQLANASGGAVLGLRGRTSEDERRALAALAALLGVPAA